MPETLATSLDLNLPTLEAVLDPIVLRRYLAPLAPEWGWEEPQSVRAEIVSGHAGSRCTLVIRIETAGSMHEMIGKLYASDRSDIARGMEGLWRAGFDAGAECSIPRPLGFIAPLNLLLQERVEGPLAQISFLAGREEGRKLAAGRCARWLACFHRTAPRVGPVFNVSEHFTALDRWSRRIMKLGEPAGAKALRLVRVLKEQAALLAPAEPCAGHGSFSPGQIILAPGRTVTFDWDGYGVADPARDVARFRVALRRLALGRLRSIRALDRAASSFLDAYAAEGGPEVHRNLRFFEAALCLQLAKYNIAHPVSHWREKLEAMLDEGLRVLEVQA